MFVLGRMGNSRQALHLIIRRLADIPQARPQSYHQLFACSWVSFIDAVLLDSRSQVLCSLTPEDMQCCDEGV